MNKKRLIAITLSVLLIGCLTGCNDSPINSESNIKDIADNNVQFIGDYSYYNNGAAYTIGSSSDYTKVFLDFDSMERAPLCAVPNCTHNTSGCLSKNIGKFYMPVF